MPNTQPSILPHPLESGPPGSAANKPLDAVSSPGSAHLRLAGFLVGLGCIAILVLAWHVQPTHLPLGPRSQLSLPACSFRQRTGYPCPTCGMTTAFSQAVRGNLGAALRANAAGAVFTLACAVAALGGLATALGPAGFYRRRLAPLLGIFRAQQWFYLAVALVVFAWACGALSAFVAANASIF